MIEITKKDLMMVKEAQKWMFIDENGKDQLLPDAPKEVKEHIERMKKLYSLID